MSARAMTAKQALAEAQRRWGANAIVQRTSGQTPMTGPCLYCGAPVDERDNGRVRTLLGLFCSREHFNLWREREQKSAGETLDCRNGPTGLIFDSSRTEEPMPTQTATR